MNIKKEIKQVIKALVFISIAILPFISITNVLGLETFLDSFENPESYICLKDSTNIVGLKTRDENFIILQKTSHPDFELKENDEVIYFEINGEMACSTIHQIHGIGSFKRYYIYNSEEENSNPIFSTQIVGKIIDVVDNNIWNDLSIQLWEVSIEYLNVETAF